VTSVRTRHADLDEKRKISASFRALMRADRQAEVRKNQYSGKQ
jgi:hypothetical protein